MKDFLTHLWTAYGGMITNFGIGIFGLLFFLCVGYFVTPIFAYMKNLSEKVLGEKIGHRVNDALSKLEIVAKRCIMSTKEVYKDEIIKAAADGDISNEELSDIKDKISAEVMEIIKPELATLKKYVAGEFVLKFVTNTVQSYLVEWAQSKIKNRPFQK